MIRDYDNGKIITGDNRPIDIKKIDGIKVGICPECLTDVNDTWVYCPYCGIKLNWG